MAGAQPTSQASDQCRVAGRSELLGVNGSLLTVELESDASEEGPEFRAFLVEGELHLAPDQSWRRAGPVLGRDRDGVGQRRDERRGGDPAVAGQTLMNPAIAASRRSASSAVASGRSGTSRSQSTMHRKPSGASSPAWN